jgi:hypothetical protein
MKYYPNSSVLEARLGNNPSFAWRGIVGSRDLVKEVYFGGLGMVEQQGYGEINGYLYRQYSPSNLFLGY